MVMVAVLGLVAGTAAVIARFDDDGQSSGAAWTQATRTGGAQTEMAAVEAGATPDRAATVSFAPIPGGVYYLNPAGEQPEVVARDKRGAHMVWPAMGNISTHFHEAGPYWVGGYHQGLDIASQWGWNVFAAWDGVVIEAATGWNRGYGTTIVIDHRNGIQTRYAHLGHSFVELGDRVEAGDLIGLVGSTGASNGPHLHFEVIVDEQLRDPLLYLPPDANREYVG